MHVNDNAAIRQMVLVPPINHSAFFIPKICRTSQPKTHPLVFYGRFLRPAGRVSNTYIVQHL